MIRKTRQYFLILILSLFLSALLHAGDFQKAVIISDTQKNLDVFQRISEKVVMQKPQAIFHAGDMVHNGLNEEQWKDFFKISKKFTDIAPFFPACGNHEKEVDVFVRHFPQFGKTSWYSTNQIGLHWIILNTKLSLAENSKQYKWLEKDLKRNRKMFSIIVMHYPVYSSSLHANDLNSLTLRNLIEKYDVNLVFSGHDHVYERSFDKGKYYIVCGGSGGDLREKMHKNPYSQFFSSTHHYCVLENHLDYVQIDVYDLQDNKIDSLTITK